MEPDLKLTKLSEDCKAGDCPAGYLTSRGTLVFRGSRVLNAAGLRLGRDEEAVEVPIETAKEVVRALGN